MRKDPSFQEVEQQWQHAEARSQDLEQALKMCSSELEIMNTKFRDCAGRLNEEEQKNEVVLNDYALLQERL